MTQEENLTINQGASFTFRAHLMHKIPDGCTDDCSIVDYDLTGKGIRAQIRRTYDACDAVEFEVTFLDMEAGRFQLYLPASVTEGMRITNYVWDMEVHDVNDPDYVIRPFSGTVTVTPEVTK